MARSFEPVASHGVNGAEGIRRETCSWPPPLRLAERFDREFAMTQMTQEKITLAQLESFLKAFVDEVRSQK